MLPCPRLAPCPSVSSLNDAYGGTPITDRNLYLNGPSFNGISIRPATAVLDTTGTTHFTTRPIAVPLATASVTGAASNAISAMHLIMPTLAGN